MNTSFLANVNKTTVCTVLLTLIIIYKGYTYEDNLLILAGGIIMVLDIIKMNIEKSSKKRDKIDNEEWHEINV
tara:strand:+ start:23661 stop:23879 length:219 start_codon:yes stop_codon:yes gene_type:complete